MSETETTGEMRARFGEAFHRYAAEQSRVMTEPQDAPAVPVCEEGHATVPPRSAAERDYRAVRLQYIDRLLSSQTSD